MASFISLIGATPLLCLAHGCIKLAESTPCRRLWRFAFWSVERPCASVLGHVECREETDGGGTVKKIGAVPGSVERP
jgi:hypothetical protein